MKNKLLLLLCIALSSASFAKLSTHKMTRDIAHKSLTVNNAKTAKKDKDVAPVQDLDGIVAIINEDVVTKTELKSAVSIIKMQARQANTPIPSDNALAKQVLDQLINKKLQLQLAKQANISISEQDVNHAVQTIAKQNNLAEEELYKRLAESGMSKDTYRKEIQDQLLLQKLQQQEVFSHIQVTQDEVNRFLRSKVWEKDIEKEYRLQDILIPLTDGANSAEIGKAKDYARQIALQLKNGQPLTQVAELTQKQFNLNNLSSNDLGFRRLQELPSVFIPYVSRMEEKMMQSVLSKQATAFMCSISLTFMRLAANQQHPRANKYSNW